MEQLASPGGLIAALSPTRGYWRTLQSASGGGLDMLVQAIAQSPMFQYTYGLVHELDEKDIILDLRAATSLMASRVLRDDEIAYFHTHNLMGYVNHGLALAARDLRPRIQNVPDSSVVGVVRSTAFTFILKLIGEDLKEPTPVLQDVVKHLHISDASRMSLIQASLANVSGKSSQIVHH